ncbi:dehydrogenase [Corynebacterium diphtheriae]|nr:dehydrogenase [Corynebacterium diphtheriae]CAB0579557.1 dehydrogenase [Corynebacterium diphtheriae]CAB0625366.1 dehydrogenase [Corynebacterium diphtheriae]
MSLTVAEAIAQRRAVRTYTDQPIPDDILDRVVAQALEAPTAFNAQRADVVVVRDQAVKDALFAASKQAQLRDAPAVLVIVARADVPTDLPGAPRPRPRRLCQWLLCASRRSRSS